MPSRYTRKRERREPEKTPLIDVIFLFLIFFFVTISGLDLELLSSQESNEVGGDRRLELLQMENPLESTPDTLGGIVLLQVQRASAVPEAVISEINKTVDAVHQLRDEFDDADFGECTGIQQRNQEQLFIAFLLDEQFPDVPAVYELSREIQAAVTRYRAEPNLETETRIRRLVTRYMPVSLPDRGGVNFTQRYENAIGEFSQRLRRHFPETLPETDRPEIHIRLDRTVYVKFIEELFELCNEQDIDRQSLKFRVLETRT